MSATTTLEDLVRAYGPNWDREGIATDHVHLALRAGAAEFVAPSGRAFLAPAGGGRAVPVVCGELVLVHTEDGPTDGRCGAPVYGSDFACPGHAAERRGWANMTDAERIAWERDHG